VAATRSDLRSNSPLTLWGVYVRELEPPPDAKPIEWLLLTTEEIETGQQAAELVGFYSRRWRIEEWHRILKTGCRVEEHQHQTGERLQRATVLDVVLAWRIQLLTLLGREVPEIPCDVFFDDWEVRVLEALRPAPSPGESAEAVIYQTGDCPKRRIVG
jgi:Transposase DDE domain